MPLELTQPWFLLGLLALPVLGWYFYRGLTDFARWQRVASLAARAVVVGLLVAALCGLTWLKPSNDLFVVFAVDDSLNVGDDAKPESDKFLNRAAAARRSTSRSSSIPTTTTRATSKCSAGRTRSSAKR